MELYIDLQYIIVKYTNCSWIHRFDSLYIPININNPEKVDNKICNNYKLLKYLIKGFKNNRNILQKLPKHNIIYVVKNGYPVETINKLIKDRLLDNFNSNVYSLELGLYASIYGHGEILKIVGEDRLDKITFTY